MTLIVHPLSPAGLVARRRGLHASNVSRYLVEPAHLHPLDCCFQRLPHLFQRPCGLRGQQRIVLRGRYCRWGKHSLQTVRTLRSRAIKISIGAVVIFEPFVEPLNQFGNLFIWWRMPLPGLVVL